MHSYHTVLEKRFSLTDYLFNAKWQQSLVYISRRYKICTTNSHLNLLKLAETCDKKGDNAQQLSGGELTTQKQKGLLYSTCQLVMSLKWFSGRSNCPIMEPRLACALQCHRYSAVPYTFTCFTSQLILINLAWQVMGHGIDKARWKNRHVSSLLTTCSFEYVETYSTYSCSLYLYL